MNYLVYSLLKEGLSENFNQFCQMGKASGVSLQTDFEFEFWISPVQLFSKRFQKSSKFFFSDLQISVWTENCALGTPLIVAILDSQEQSLGVFLQDGGMFFKKPLLSLVYFQIQETIFTLLTGKL